MSAIMSRGGCLCGAVRFEVKGQRRGVVYCHCKQCRKQTGHHVAATRAEDANLTILGEANITWFAASDAAKRGFCKTCGSQLFWKRQDSNATSIWAGAFETPSGLVASHHIFVADKGDYYTIDDGLPQFPQSD